ncbi:MAG TPA: LLM class flavin-dependent oxidoreductase [Candidatus Binatia bacterium]|jgi:alkanesulfonate monooxygenase SsuD/methylene tetrahydromethanopterin reductase-like flavin-dependent oxidoreductase (luciferase family)
MRIAIGLPSRVASASGGVMLEWITRAERGPFSSVVVTDRVVSQALEPLTVLAMAAGATRRIRLMTSIVLAPTRETTLFAREAATLDVLSGGRLTLGIGIGVRKNDYLATGFDFHRRGRRVEEQLPLLRRLWSGENLSGETGAIGPRSSRPNGPELLIGGYVPAIARRIAKWGDGYMAPGGGEPEALAAMWRNIEIAWREERRAGKPRWVGASYYALGPGGADYAKRYIEANYGYNPELAAKRLATLPATDKAVEAAIKRQADMGVDEFILRPCADDLDQMERLAEIAARVG